jgi:proteasome lid subunit RPN8/RPN11
MTLALAAELLLRIQREGERAYPDEGAGFLLGLGGDRRIVMDIVATRNLGVDGTSHNRYMISPADYVQAEQEAESLKMDVLGVFHSHPDHPDEPSEFDRDWAQPNFSYVITSVRKGEAVASRSWLLTTDRTGFEEEALELIR